MTHRERLAIFTAAALAPVAVALIGGPLWGYAAAQSAILFLIWGFW